MINKYELMLGNWATGSVRPNEPMQIKDLSENICKLGEYIEDYKSISSIPISPALLLKIGFKINEDFGFDSSENIKHNVYVNNICLVEIGNEFFIWEEVVDDVYYNWKGVKIDSIHKLQNYYDLHTGAKLEVKFG